MRARLIILVSFCLGLAPLAFAQDDSASEQTRTAITETELQALVQEVGYKAVIDRDESGPFIDSAASGVRFYIGLYDCDDAMPASCTVLNFLSDYLAADIDKAKAKALEWNNSSAWWQWSRISLDSEGRPALSYSVSLNGGVTDSFVRVVLQDFISDIEAFQKALAN